MREQEMIAARQRHKPRSGDVRREQASLVEGDSGFVLAVEDNRRHLNTAEQGRTSIREEFLHQPRRVLRRG